LNYKPNVLVLDYDILASIMQISKNVGGMT
jgi:hypothetical protein